MPLAPGTRLGPYEISDRLGMGGMGEVYRATDSTLGREVALKVLPEAFALDADRLARFEREARTLASLNHPNIAIVFGFERVSHETDAGQATRALVMELVDGPTLADLIAQGPIAVDEALPIAKQIAEALEAAHEHGIIHRDLKPANVKLRADGRVKVLDFGLAKAMESATAMSSMASMSPTITTPAMTQAGILLGTAAYMSPEQARGKRVDKRADIWAFGCVLFEMLSGRRTIANEETVSDTLASVLNGEPVWNALPADIPPRIRTLIERCLRKDVRRRLPDIAEARIQIDEAAGDPVTPLPTATVTPRRGFVWPAVSLVSLLTAVGLAAWMALRPAPEDETIRFPIYAPAGATPLAIDGRLMAIGPGISPDGLTVAFFANVDGRRLLWVRPLNGELQPLEGTEDAERSAWSPDSRQIAFVTRTGMLRRVTLGGGPPTDICKLQARDIAWAPGAVILVGGNGRPLTRVSPENCDLQPATTLAPGETTHDYPHALPDRRHFLYLSRRGAEAANWTLYVGSLDSSELVPVPGIHSGARYTAGHLVFVRDGALMAQPFDVERLRQTGDAFQLDYGLDGPAPAFSVSGHGSLAYVSVPTTRTTQLVWFDPNGKQLGVLGEPGDYRRFDLSADDRFIAFDRVVSSDRGQDVFVLDIERGGTIPVVSTPAADFSAVWSPNEAALAFASSREPAENAGPMNVNAGNLYRRVFGVVQPDTLLSKTDFGKTPSDWSIHDYVAYTSQNDIWALKVPVSADPIRVTDTDTSRERDGRFSPDGQWIAYESSDTGRPTEVYVQSFPDGSASQPVSTNGGSSPRWSRDGRKLFYVASDSMLMSVSIVREGSGIRISPPQRVFQLPVFAGALEYEVARDGRFLVNLPMAKQTAPPLRVIHHWGASLKKK